MPRLSLSLGLRWEYEKMPSTIPSLVNPAVPQTFQLPSDKNNFGPRVGFAWDIFGNSKTVLRGGYGIYYGRIINSTIFNALLVTGMPGSQVSLNFTPTTAGAPLFPSILTNLNGAGKSVDYFDSNFQAPQIHQIDLTLEREIGWGTVFSVSYLGSLGRQLPNFADTNICTAQGQGPGCTNAIPNITYLVTGNGPIPSGTTFSEPLYRQRINPNFSTMTDIFSGTNSSYHALVAQISHRMSHNIQFNANYTWAHAIDFGQNQSTFSDTNDTLLPINLPNAIAAEKGNSIYDIPNRFVVNAVITSPWKKTGWLGYLTNDWEVAPIYQVQNGLPLNLVTSGSPSILAGTALQGGLGSGINGSGGAARLAQIGRNNSRLPLTWVQDIRLSKSFTFQERYKVELMADAFNIANKQNITTENNTGYGIVNPSVIAGTPTPCTGATTTAVSCLNFSPTFGTAGNSNNNFVYSPRELQLGVRVHF
jgi:hypothetical protein